MEIKSEGYTVHFSLDEASALLKIIGKASFYTLIKTFDLDESEANQVQSMYEKLSEVVPHEVEAG